MKCIVCEHPDRFSIKEISRPTLKPDEALVRIRRIGICGTDLHAYKGNQPYFSYPRVLGHELAGYIEEIGSNSYGLKEGDQVAVIPYLECGRCAACRSGKPNCCLNLRVMGVHLDGGMCELLAVPVDHLLKTEGLTLDQTAIIEPLSIGAHAVRRSGLHKGQPALVVGAGPIGLAVIAFARQQEAEVMVLDTNEDRLNFAQKWAGIDRTGSAKDPLQQNLAAMAGGVMPQVVFDATGSAGSMRKSFDYVANGGTLVFVGLVKGEITFSDEEFHRKELTLLGSRNATRQDFETVKQTVQNGAIDTTSYITHRASFEQLIDRFEDLFNPALQVIKTLVEI